VDIINWCTENWAVILVFIGSAVGLAQVIVNSTPSPKDNEVLAKIIWLLQLLRLYPKDPQ
jgi:hypothetical protein